jgi:hypothetical protein
MSIDARCYDLIAGAGLEPKLSTEYRGGGDWLDSLSSVFNLADRFLYEASITTDDPEDEDHISRLRAHLVSIYNKARANTKDVNSMKNPDGSALSKVGRAAEKLPIQRAFIARINRALSDGGIRRKIGVDGFVAKEIPLELAAAEGHSLPVVASNAPEVPSGSGRRRLVGGGDWKKSLTDTLNKALYEISIYEKDDDITQGRKDELTELKSRLRQATEIATQEMRDANYTPEGKRRNKLERAEAKRPIFNTFTRYVNNLFGDADIAARFEPRQPAVGEKVKYMLKFKPYSPEEDGVAAPPPNPLFRSVLSLSPAVRVSPLTPPPPSGEGSGRVQGGRGRASGFIMRMMAENKKKHNGQYRNPSGNDYGSTMKQFRAFDYNRLANSDQSGTNKSSYGASPFIIKHFGSPEAVPFVPKAQRGSEEHRVVEGETEEQKASRLQAKAEELAQLAKDLLEKSSASKKVKGFLKGKVLVKRAKDLLNDRKRYKREAEERKIEAEVQKDFETKALAYAKTLRTEWSKVDNPLKDYLDQTVKVKGNFFASSNELKTLMDRFFKERMEAKFPDFQKRFDKLPYDNTSFGDSTRDKLLHPSYRYNEPYRRYEHKRVSLEEGKKVYDKLFPPPTAERKEKVKGFLRGRIAVKKAKELLKQKKDEKKVKEALERPYDRATEERIRLENNASKAREEEEERLRMLAERRAKASASAPAPAPAPAPKPSMRDFFNQKPQKGASWATVRTYINSLAGPHKLERAVAMFRNLNMDKTERQIAKEAGVSQPSVTRWKKKFADD